jgi:hypothetical protein
MSSVGLKTKTLGTNLPSATLSWKFYKSVQKSGIISHK